MKKKYMKGLMTLLLTGAMFVSSVPQGTAMVLAADASGEIIEEAAAEIGTVDDALAAVEDVTVETPAEDLMSGSAVDEVKEAAADEIENDTAEEAEGEAINETAEEIVGDGDIVYVLMNIPYGEFYAAEGDSAVDAVSSSTYSKPRAITLAGGSYHIDETGSDITGVIYPVEVDKDEFAALKDKSSAGEIMAVTDEDSKSYTVKLRGKDVAVELKGKDVLFEAPSYSYYVLTEKPVSYKALTIDGDTYSFGAATGEVTEVSGVTAEKVTYFARHADIEIVLNGISIPEAAEGADPVYVNGVVVTDEDGTQYALRHVKDLWRNTQIGWNFDDDKLGALTGKTITNIRYYLSDGSITDYPVEIDTSVYLLMNIPYAEFYAGEGDEDVDAVSSATKSKPRAITLAGGSYHVNEDGSDITGVVYPVKPDVDTLKALKTMKAAGTVSVVTDNDSKSYTVKLRGNEVPVELKGKDVLFESPTYSFYVLSAEPASYKEVSASGDAFTFGKATGKVESKEGLTGVVKLNARHADVEIVLSGVEIPTAAEGEDAIYVNGVVVTDENGKQYALRHVTELWRNTQIGWNYDDAKLGGLTGTTITNIRYYLSDGSITDYPCEISYKVAKYNGDAAKPALVQADDQTQDQYTTYISAISKVTIDGKEYDNKTPVIIGTDGSIDMDAEADGNKVFEGLKRYTVKVEATAHDDLEFIIGGFTDVQDPTHVYFDAIYWGADEGITKGYADGSFGIDTDCSRGAAIMFLWRLAGEPSVKWRPSKFSDVKTDHPYYRAILWAQNEGITKGYKDGTFGIDRACTRGDMMMFIWRYKGMQAPGFTLWSPFKDVKKSHPYYSAIVWAKQNNVAKGYKGGTFGINQSCTRGQAMQFLYNLSKQ